MKTVQIIGSIGNATLNELLMFIAAENLIIKDNPNVKIFNPLRLKGNAYESMLVCIDNLIIHTDELFKLPTITKSAGAKIELLINDNSLFSKKSYHYDYADLLIEISKIDYTKIKLNDYNRVLRQRVKEAKNDK